MEEIIVCHCRGVSEASIVRAIRNGAHALEGVKAETGACTGNRCKTLNPKNRCCSADALRLIERELGTPGYDKCGCGVDKS